VEPVTDPELVEAIDEQARRLDASREEVVAVVQTVADMYELEGAAVYPIELPLAALINRLRRIAVDWRAGRSIDMR
jgi:hypothetical protein